MRFLREHEGRCIIHIFLGDPAAHKLYSCRYNAAFTSQYHPFRKSFRFSVGMCYRCGVPTSSVFDHPNRDKNDPSPCRYDDMLKPFAFLIYAVPSIRDVVLLEAGGSPGTVVSPEQFGQWVGATRPTINAISNLWELTHAYIHLVSTNRLGFPSVFCVQNYLTHLS
jgi:hypothetical protein